WTRTCRAGHGAPRPLVGRALQAREIAPSPPGEARRSPPRNLEIPREPRLSGDFLSVFPDFSFGSGRSHTHPPAHRMVLPRLASRLSCCKLHSLRRGAAVRPAPEPRVMLPAVQGSPRGTNDRPMSIQKEEAQDVTALGPL